LNARIHRIQPGTENLMAQVRRSPEEHEVVVVGSGAGGGSAVQVLTEKGIKVTLLEAGPMLDPAKEFKEHMWPYEVDHRGAEEGGAAYFGKGKSFGYFTTTSGGWQLDGEPYTVGEGSEFQWFRSRIIGGTHEPLRKNVLPLLRL
jgi:choline dehydrogenase-like flavoprotein